MPYHARSTTTPGPRRPVTHGDKAMFLARANAARSARRLTRNHVDIGRAMLSRIGADGRLDPSRETLAADVELSVRTVQRATDAMHAVGLLRWDRRRACRAGSWQSEQTSNAYEILLPPEWDSPETITRRSGGQIGLGGKAPQFFSYGVPSDGSGEPVDISDFEAAATRAAIAQARAAAAWLEGIEESGRPGDGGS